MRLTTEIGAGRRIRAVIRQLVFALLALVLVLPAWAKSPDKNDVRVLIDISGSMRDNDPQNLRRPALRMLVGLMQSETRAGVWTFAKWTNPLVPLAEVDEAWKKRAISLSKQIKSPGQFTDIERILNDAMKDWSGDPTTHNRHLVLLTDGMVDVSKQTGESEASRQRIIDELLPRIKSLGVKVHTVALSERADHELMKQLSEHSGGWYQQVESADSLQRVFLRIFEQVGKPDAVPLEGNRFTVDASVREATVLLFRKDGSEAPILVSPDGSKFTDSDLPGGVAWYRDQGYDLITVASPSKGEWTLQADLDPDNRVMIVTDLKLETSEIPAHIAVGEQLSMSANLSNRGKLVDRKAFLRLLEVRADAMTEAGTDPQGLNDVGQEGDATAGDGRYTMLYREQLPFEQVELLFSVDSPTFMREKRYRLAVHEPAELLVEGEGDDLRAQVKVNTAVLREGAELAVWQADSSGAKIDLVQDAQGTAWLVKVADAPVHASVKGQTRLGNLVEREYGPVYPPGIEPAAAAAPQPVPAPEEPKVSEPETAPVEPQAEQETAEEKQEPEAEDDWVMPAVLFGGANLLFILIGLGVWWWMRKRRGDDSEESLLDELDLSDDKGSTDEDATEVVASDPVEGEAA